MEKKEYKFRKGLAWDVDPQVAGEIIDKLASKNKEKEVTPDMVVNEAKNPKSPLHNCFDWNDSSAAAKWRKHTARLLLGSIVVEIITNKPEKIRAFVNIKHSEEKQFYYNIDTVMADEEKMNIVIAQAKAKLIAASNQLKSYERLKHIALKIDELVLEFD